MLPFYDHTHFPLIFTSSLVSGDHQSIFHFYNFVISRVLYKWNYTVYDLGEFLIFYLV